MFGVALKLPDDGGYFKAAWQGIPDVGAVDGATPYA